MDPNPEPSPATNPEQNQAPSPARLLLILLPEGERRLEFAEPMGTPAQLSTRIAELLPGTTFDADRHGVFRRGGYEINLSVFHPPVMKTP